MCPAGGNTVYKMVRGAHEGPVFSILVQKDGAIITGGKDGNIVEWDRDLERTGNVIQVSCSVAVGEKIYTGEFWMATWALEDVMVDGEMFIGREMWLWIYGITIW